MGGGSQNTQAQQVSKVELPAWVNQASQENYQMAKDVSGRPLEQFQGDRVAAPSDMTQQGYDMLQKLLGNTNPLFDKATGSYDKANSIFDQATGMYNATAPMYDKANESFGKATGMLDSTNPLFNDAANLYKSTSGPLDISGYLNPYTSEVEQRAVGNANTALDQQLLKVSDNASKAGAFGGSRSAIESGVTRSEGARSIGDLTAALRKAGVDYATTTGLQDRAGIRDSAGGLLSTASGRIGAASGYGNAGSGYLNTAAGMRDTAGGLGNVAAGVGSTGAGYLNTAAGRQTANMNDLSALFGAGASEQGSRQKLIDAAMGKFDEARNYPVEQLNMRLAALGMSPYGKTETSNKTTSTETPTDWATTGLGVLKTLPALWAMSDRNTKTDITKLTDGDIPMYSYRYKGDPKSYPKVVGPMAQDIEKKYPSAVKKVGRYKTVDINNLMEVLR